jgi:hypothetical protein
MSVPPAVSHKQPTITLFPPKKTKSQFDSLNQSGYQISHSSLLRSLSLSAPYAPVRPEWKRDSQSGRRQANRLDQTSHTCNQARLGWGVPIYADAMQPVLVHMKVTSGKSTAISESGVNEPLLLLKVTLHMSRLARLWRTVLSRYGAGFNS